MAASAMDLTCKGAVGITGTASKTGVEFESVDFDLAHTFSSSLADGTGANQANQVYQDSVSAIADAETSYDLAGSLTDEFGGTITFTIIKGILLKNTSVTASVLQIGGGTGCDGTNAFDTWITSTAANGSEGVLVRPGGCFFLWAPGATGYAVTAGSIDILVVKEKSTLAALFELTIVGVV